MKIFKVKKAELIIVLALIAAGIFMLILRQRVSGAGVKCEISRIGVESFVVDLNKNKRFNAFNMENIEFEIEGGAIRFLHSDCPDKICEKAGFIKNVGEIAVCLPNKISVKIVSDNIRENEIDAISK